MNYTTVKELAKQRKCRVTDLIALAPQNDPFYVGTPGDWVNGEWFAGLWKKFGFYRGVHIRRVHYRMVTADDKIPFLRPNGLPYENTETDWDFLSQASKTARYLGLVDPDAFIDKRNDPPRIFAFHSNDEPSIEVTADTLSAAAFPDFPDLPDYSVCDYASEQRYHLEVWCEKSTMDDVLVPICRAHGVNLVIGAGEMSITSVRDLLKRTNGKPTRLLYISDFDPAGQSMPCAVARKVEWFQ